MWGARARVLQKSKKVLQKSKQGRKYRVSILKDAKRKFRSLSAFCKKFLWVLVLFSKGGVPRETGGWGANQIGTGNRGWG